MAVLLRAAGRCPACAVRTRCWLWLLQHLRLCTIPTFLGAAIRLHCKCCKDQPVACIPAV